MKGLFYFVWVTCLFVSCAPKIGSSIRSQQSALPDTAFVLVLQKDDDFMNDGIAIGTIKSGDNGLSANCTYFEVVDQLCQLARKNGANLIKINSRKEPDRMSTCVRLTASIYRVPDLRKHEKEIVWSERRKLEWEDFKGVPKISSESHIAALTYCGFSFQTNFVTMFGKAKVFTKNTFNCDLSWVKPDQKKPEILEHEQCHFDICEVYTRMLQVKLDDKKLSAFNLNVNANIIFEEVSALYIDRQALYEKETSHGLNREKQAEWTRQIQKELGIH